MSALVLALACAGSALARDERAASPSEATALARQLSTATGAARYLRSLGIDPAGVVVQRGTRNYAGPHCPGSSWNCTRSLRVLQLSAGGTNSASCQRVGSGTGVTTQSCVIAQTSTNGDNTATCTERATGAGASLEQECKVTQTTGTGTNAATILQTSTQGTSSCTGSGTTSQRGQSATQRATLVQASASGAMRADVTQDAGQCVTLGGTGSAAQQQTTLQEFTILQGPQGFDPGNPSCANKTGTLDAVARQTQRQSGYASSAGSGTQRQRADLIGNVDQCSTSLAQYTATQTENQFLAPNPNVDQTQIGPSRVGLGRAAQLGKGKRALARGICCSFQGTNPADTCTITQRARQQGNGDAAQTEELISRAGTTGSCRADLSVTQNEVTKTASASGATVNVTLECVSGSCGPENAPTALTWTGQTEQDYGDVATLAARLIRTDTNAALAGQPLALAVGSRSCTATTNASGVGTCTVTIADPPGPYTASATFAGTDELAASTTTVAFTVVREEVTLAYVGPTEARKHTPVTLKGSLTWDGNALAGRTLTFTIGSQSCSGTTDAYGKARCTLTLTQYPGTYTLRLAFGGDTLFEPRTVSVSFRVKPRDDDDD